MEVQSKVNSSSNNIRSDQEEELMELRRGPWTVEEDFALINYVAHHGEGRWNSLSRSAGLKRTGKSCRLRWLNYLRPDVRRGNITLEEQLLILELHSRWGNRWSKIAQHLPGRTDNEIKNYWRTRVQKHAKQLKCDVNSKQFKDTMRYLWMPRLVERIQAANASTTSTTTTSSSTTTTTTTYNIDHLDHMGSSSSQNHQYHETTHMLNQQHDHHNVIGSGMPLSTTYNTTENSSTAVSSDSFGTPVSDLTECYNNYPVINDNNNNQDYYPVNQVANYGDQALISPVGGYFNQGMDFMEQSSCLWMDGGDVSDNLWNVDDVWF